MNYPEAEIHRLIKIALGEDIGSGDITSQMLVPETTGLRAKIVAKADGVICGLRAVADVYDALFEGVVVKALCHDGDRVFAGDVIARVEGPARAVLAGERVALNILCRLSGIATATDKFSKLLDDTGCQVLDTRKTTPGMRMAEKYAVATGGGGNHRLGLWDMILIKENHIEAAGGIRRALEKIYSEGLPDVPVEIEVKNLEELEIALEFPLDRIMLDNFTPDSIKKAVAIREKTGKVVPFEASGGITLENCRSFAEAGVEFISSGSLTHSVKALDISMIAGERY